MVARIQHLKECFYKPVNHWMDYKHLPWDQPTAKIPGKTDREPCEHSKFDLYNNNNNNNSAH